MFVFVWIELPWKPYSHTVVSDVSFVFLRDHRSGVNLYLGKYVPIRPVSTSRAADFHSDAATQKTLTGKITHVGSSEIAGNSKVLVQIQDVSMMDAAAETLASVTITDATSFPISYTLKYDPSKVKAHHRYSMSVRINGPDAKLHFINDVHTPANLEQAAPNVDIAVIRGNDHRRSLFFIERRVAF